jgi:hypothetical protein
MRGLILPGVLFLGWLGCSTETANPLAGKWIEVTDSAAKMDLEFDGKSDKFQLCNDVDEGKPGHDHLQGQCAMADGKLTLSGTWESNRKPETITGALQGDRLILELANGKKGFRRQ